MKTFDIALEYLKGIDFSKYDIYVSRKIPSSENASVIKQIVQRKVDFDSDENNKFSNDYYRSMVFESCIYHLIDLAQGRASYFEMACDIVEAHRDILKTKFTSYTERSIYPKVMVENFINFCNSLKPQPLFLNDKSDVRVEFFTSAFHYVIDDNC